MRSIIFSILLFHFSGCKNEGYPNMANDKIQWKEYTNASIGYSISVPEDYDIQEWDDQSGVVFRLNGNTPMMLIRFSSEKEGKHRGIWFNHDPISKIELAGKEGQFYDYYHFDGPSGIRTRSYVIPFKGEELGIEFRTKVIGVIEETILNSLKL